MSPPGRIENSGPGPLERLLRRDRLIAVSGLALLAALSWVYVLQGAGTGMSVWPMTTWQFPPPVPDLVSASEWGPGYWLTMFLMWWVMMIAMMVPSAAPVILLYARVWRQGQARGQIVGVSTPVAAFTSGYLIAWAAFSALATLLQFTLEGTGLFDAMTMWSVNRWLPPALLIAAGLYQVTPLKGRCLEHCRSPAAWLSRAWRPGMAGAFRMGAVHGTYCLGCCAGLMLLLFAGGIMNLLWIGGLSILVLIEKLSPFGARLGPAIGLVLIAAGLWTAGAHTIV